MASLVPPAATPKPTEKVDYMNLPCPIPYEEIHREALSLSPPSSSSILIVDFAV